MRFFRKNKISNLTICQPKVDKYAPIRTVVEHKKVCTIPVYLWKDELKNICEDTIMNNLLDYDYYNYALEEKYKTIEDHKRWVSDGDTMMHFKIYEIKVEITYEIETVFHPRYAEERKYKEITGIKYLGLCRRVSFEKLGMEKVLGNEDKNILIKNINDVDKLHKLTPAVYCRDKYFSMTKNTDLDSEFIKEIYKLKIKPYEDYIHSYLIIEKTNNAIYCINKMLNENKGISKEMIAYKITKELMMA